MKHIVLAKNYKRIFARLIDFIIVISLTSLFFFTLVFPATFNETKYKENLDLLGTYYENSGLYLKSDKGSFAALDSFTSIKDLKTLEDINLNVDDNKFEHVNTLEMLYKFYTTKLTDYGATNNLTKETFITDIIKPNNEISNIKTFDYDGTKFEISLMDDKKESYTVSYILERYGDARKVVENYSEVKNLMEENQKNMLNSLKYFVYLLVGLSFIFDLIIPLCLKNGQSIGKLIFGFGVIRDDGYKLPKYYLIFRWLVYIVFDIILGFMTMLGTILISYTMLLFNKKRKTVHDYAAKSIVINLKESIFFDSPLEEKLIEEKMKLAKLK